MRQLLVAFLLLFPLHVGAGGTAWEFHVVTVTATDAGAYKIELQPA